MENTENMVDLIQQGSAPDDTAQANADSLSSIVEETAPQTQQQEQQKEPGWIKQRVNKAVEKAVAEAEARVRSQYEAMLAPIRESVLERQANDLVAQGEFKSLERAKEYLRLKGGMPAEAPAPTQPEQQQQQNRDAQGRFVSADKGTEDDAARHARADILAKQAQKIKSTRGVDVMDMFQADDAVKQRVLSGEWDFYDVAEQMTARRSIPAPMRTPNAGAMSGVSIMNMTDEQFARLQANLSAGRTYDLRK